MTDILTFSNTSFNIECIVVDGLPWFKGKQVATILGYANTKNAIINNVREQDKKRMEEIGGPPNGPLDYNAKHAMYINESGLYDLVFSSKKEEAREFRRWVTAEVLPTIRKTGMYNMMDMPQQQHINIYNESDLHKKVI